MPNTLPSIESTIFLLSYLTAKILSKESLSLARGPIQIGRAHV